MLRALSQVARLRHTPQHHSPYRELSPHQIRYLSPSTDPDYMRTMFFYFGISRAMQIRVINGVLMDDCVDKPKQKVDTLHQSLHMATTLGI